jgi:predicted acetyltransferase
MDVELHRATAEDRARLAALFELYMYDFSELLGLEVSEEGRFHPPTLDDYFEAPGAHAFLIRAGGHLAGFALVKQGSRLTDAPDVHDVAELFVVRRHRRHRVGERAAHALFTRFPGPWEVRQRQENLAATAFWRATIARFGEGRYEEIVVDDERWRGPVQRFTSR